MSEVPLQAHQRVGVRFMWDNTVIKSSPPFNLFPLRSEAVIKRRAH